MRKEISFSVRGIGKQQVRRFKRTVNHLSCRVSPCCSSSAGKYHFLRGKSITEVGGDILFCVHYATLAAGQSVEREISPPVLLH